MERCNHKEHKDNIPCDSDQFNMLYLLGINLIDAIESHDPIELEKQLKIGKLIIKRVKDIQKFKF